MAFRWGGVSPGLTGDAGDYWVCDLNSLHHQEFPGGVDYLEQPCSTGCPPGAPDYNLPPALASVASGQG